MKRDLRSLSEDDCFAIVKAMNEKPFRGKQLFEWIHRKRVCDIDRMTNLPLEMREKLKEEYISDPLKLEYKRCLMTEMPKSTFFLYRMASA